MRWRSHARANARIPTSAGDTGIPTIPISLPMPPCTAIGVKLTRLCQGPTILASATNPHMMECTSRWKFHGRATAQACLHQGPIHTFCHDLELKWSLHSWVKSSSVHSAGPNLHMLQHPEIEGKQPAYDKGTNTCKGRRPDHTFLGHISRRNRHVGESSGVEGSCHARVKGWSMPSSGTCQVQVCPSCRTQESKGSAGKRLRAEAQRGPNVRGSFPQAEARDKSAHPSKYSNWEKSAMRVPKNRAFLPSPHVSAKSAHPARYKIREEAARQGLRPEWQRGPRLKHAFFSHKSRTSLHFWKSIRIKREQSWVRQKWSNMPSAGTCEWQRCPCCNVQQSRGRSHSSFSAQACLHQSQVHDKSANHAK